MGDRPEIRRLAGLTAVMLGLAAIFASLTAVAVSRPGLASSFAAGGVVLTVLGLRWLPRDAS